MDEFCLHMLDEKFTTDVHYFIHKFLIQHSNYHFYFFKFKYALVLIYGFTSIYFFPLFSLLHFKVSGDLSDFHETALLHITSINVL
jgi:hypothetical protein